MLMLYALLPLLVAADGGGYAEGPPKKHDDGPKHSDGYAVGPKKAPRVQNQAPVFFCPANSGWDYCPPPVGCEPSCQNYYPSCTWNVCYAARCTCYQGYYRQSSASNAPCIAWQQCYNWGAPRGFVPRPPRTGRPNNGRTPWRWWGTGRRSG